MHRPFRPWSRAVRAAAVLLASSLPAACASRQGAPPNQVSTTPTTVRVETPSGAIEARTVAEDRTETHTINVKPDVAWAKLPAVYGELGLPVNTYVDDSRQIAAKNARLRGHLGKLRLSSLIACGTDLTGDDKANSYEVTLDVATAITPAPDGQSYVLTMVTANARPMTTSGEPVRCVTTGNLEKRIATALLVKSAAP